MGVTWKFPVWYKSGSGEWMPGHLFPADSSGVSYEQFGPAYGLEDEYGKIVAGVWCFASHEGSDWRHREV